MRLIMWRVRRGAGDERGAVAILVAVSMVMLLVITAMVLDFGLVRMDRQRAKAAADAAVMAGLRAADGGTEKVHTFSAVCAALAYLKANDSDFSSLSLGSTCSAPAAGVVCDPSNPSAPGTQAVYTGSVTANGVTSTVTIKSPYSLSDGNFAEESLGTLAGDGSAMNGCDQVGVIITQSRKPGLGSLATSGDLKLRVRSVGRVKVGDGDVAPALILLERTKCQVLTNGSSGAGNDSKIWVYGSVVAGSKTPASIHSDSDASDSACGSGPNSQLLAGNKADGIIAFGSNAGNFPGLISTYATLVGRAANVVSDGLTNVYGTTAKTEASLPGTKPPLAGRDRVGRLIADQHYLPGVTAAVIAARSTFLAGSGGYTKVVGCQPSNPADKASYQADLLALTESQSVYIDCPGNSGITINATINAGTIYFHGYVKGGNIHMPNATKVYIDNTNNSDAKVNDDALNLGNGDTFCMRGLTCTSYAVNTCSSAATGQAVHGQLFVRRGRLSSAGGGLLRLCNTTAYMMGGQLGLGTAASPGGCLPNYKGSPPTTTPCTGASTAGGSGQIQLAGATDWTAPNMYDDMKANPPNLSDSQIQAMWDAGEDLALWDETYDVSPNFKMAGGAQLNVSGVFFLPNAFPMIFSGGAVFDLRDAQFITRSFAVDGGAQLLMRVDPYNAIRLPKLDKFTLVR